MARLIPALCPQCGGPLTLDPALEWVTCSFCRATSFVETPARRHAPNHPPPHVQVVRVTPERFPTAFVIVLAILGVVGAAATDLPRLLASSSLAAGASHVSYLRDASPLRPLVTKKVGGDPQVFGLDVYPEYALVHVAVTPALDAFDTVVVRRGAVQSRAPMVVPPRGAVAPQRVMRLSQVDLSRIASLVADAKGGSAFPGERPSTSTSRPPSSSFPRCPTCRPRPRAS